jgi:hypothetical protein
LHPSIYNTYSIWFAKSERIASRPVSIGQEVLISIIFKPDSCPMKKNIIFYFFLLISASPMAQAQTIDEQLIREARTASNLAIAKKDVEGISKFWLPDFVVVRGNGTYLAGKKAIIRMWEETFKTSPQTSFIRTQHGLGERHMARN